MVKNFQAFRSKREERGQIIQAMFDEILGRFWTINVFPKIMNNCFNKWYLEFGLKTESRDKIIDKIIDMMTAPQFQNES